MDNDRARLRTQCEAQWQLKHSGPPLQASSSAYIFCSIGKKLFKPFMGTEEEEPMVLGEPFAKGTGHSTLLKKKKKKDRQLCFIASREITATDFYFNLYIHLVLFIPGCPDASPPPPIPPMVHHLPVSGAESGFAHP